MRNGLTGEIFEMLYFIKTKVNDFIKEHLNSAAMAVIDPDSIEPFYFTFVQCKETDEGLLISSGYDEYLPSSSMHMLSGDIRFDEQNKVIHIGSGKRRIEIRQASRDRAKNIQAYLGTYTSEDVERMKKHIAQIENE